MNEKSENAKKTCYNLFSLRGPSRKDTVAIPTSTTDESSGSFYSRRYFDTNSQFYDKDYIERTISRGNKDEIVELSRYFYSRGGFYKQIVSHYANLIYYRGILVPNPKIGVKLSNDEIKKLYMQAVSFTDHMKVSDFCISVATKALVDGSYFGVILEMEDDNFCVLELPNKYCRSNYKDQFGNELIEFDLSYFSTFSDIKVRNATLRTYPKVFREAYKNYTNQRRQQWFLVPAEIGVCFSMPDGRPYFLDVISASMDYDEAVAIDRDRNLEEIRKIIVQKIPHDNENNFLLEPDEALELHEGTVAMMKSNKNISVLTTYADVDSIVSKTSAETGNNAIERSLQHVFNKAGISPQIFSSNGSTTLAASIKEDIAAMWGFILKLQSFVTEVINQHCGEEKIDYKFIFLPVGVHNEEDYVGLYKDLASLGYSWLVPAAAMGINQVDLINIKTLEHDVLKLQDTLKPLESSFTQSVSDGKNGAPKKEQEDKAPQTIKNEESQDRTQGGSK